MPRALLGVRLNILTGREIDGDGFADLRPPGAASLPIFHLNSPTFSQENLTAADADCRETVALCKRREQNTNNPIRGDCRNVFQFNDL